MALIFDGETGRHFIIGASGRYPCNVRMTPLATFSHGSRIAADHATLPKVIIPKRVILYIRNGLRGIASQGAGGAGHCNEVLELLKRQVRHNTLQSDAAVDILAGLIQCSPFSDIP